MYIYTCICICVCTYLHTCVYTSYMYIYLFTCIYTYIYLLTCRGWCGRICIFQFACYPIYHTICTYIYILACVFLWMLSFGSLRYVRVCVCVSHTSMYIYPNTNMYCSLLATQSNMKNDSELTFENLFADACFRSNRFSDSVTHCDTHCTHSNI